MNQANATVYVGMAGDLIHPGHLNLLAAARRLGPVTVGLLSDAAIASYKRRPLLAFEQRETVVAGLAGVVDVVRQETLDVVPNLRRLRPRWFVHGDDWRTGVLQDVRQTVERTLAEWGGELVEPAYTEGVSSSALAARLGERRLEPRVRQARLEPRGAHLLRAVGAWDARSAEVVESSQADAVWVAPRFRDDTECQRERWVGSEAFAAGELLQSLQPLLSATDRPILVDALTATTPGHVAWLVRTLDALGISTLFLETRGDSLRTAAALPDRRIRVGAKIRSRDARGFRRALDSALAAGAEALCVRGGPGADAAIEAFVRQGQGPPVWIELEHHEVERESRLRKAGVRGVAYPALLERAASEAMRRAAGELARLQGQFK